ncbi:uncharacterized protein LOC120431545 [Culex pipiens pallens]|uniref:uncharacterized protein LOC120431545 n=1 Tax=Culex pipiens pallens TaxID=42434 RepID=UPI0022AA714C|nr:uncharacterized protein LOC120431545 [Culex pipiens pallens]
MFGELLKKASKVWLLSKKPTSERCNKLGFRQALKSSNSTSWPTKDTKNILSVSKRGRLTKKGSKSKSREDNTRQREKPSSHKRQETQSANAASTTSSAIKGETEKGKILASVRTRRSRLLQKCLFARSTWSRLVGRSEKAEKSAEPGRARCRRKVASAKTVKAIGWRNNGLHVKSYQLIEGSTSPEGFPTRQERPRSGILDRHAPATIGGTEPLRGQPSGQATASTTPPWHAIPQRRCETIARTHTHTAQQTQDRLRAYWPRTTHPAIRLAVRQELEDNLEEAHEKGDAKSPFFVYRWKICSEAERSVGAVKSGRVCSELAFTRANGGRADQVREESSVAGTANVDRRGAIGVRHRS